MNGTSRNRPERPVAIHASTTPAKPNSMLPIQHPYSNSGNQVLDIFKPSPADYLSFPISHSRPSPALAHLTSSMSGSPPISHFLTWSSVKPAARSLSAPCCFHF